MPPRLRLAHELGFDEATEDILVFAGCCFRDGFLVCAHKPETFEDFAAPWLYDARGRRAPPKAQAPRSQIPKDHVMKLRQEYPWLTDADFGIVRRKRATRNEGRRTSHASVGDDKEEVETESDKGDEERNDKETHPDFGDDEVEGELAMWREDRAQKAQEDMAFYWRVLGGKWTKKNKGGRCRLGSRIRSWRHV